MTTTAGDVDLQNRVRLTFGDEEALPLDGFIVTLDGVYNLCVAASWLVAYVSGVPITPLYAGRMDSARRIGEPEVPLVDQRVVVWPTNHEFTPPDWAVPKVARLTKQSPLWIDLVFEVVPALAASGGVTAFVIAALKNPEAIGGWLPGIAAGWHTARVKALQARLEAGMIQKRTDILFNRHQWPPAEMPPEFNAEDPELRSIAEREVRHAAAVARGDEQQEDVFGRLAHDLDHQIIVVKDAARQLRSGSLSQVQDEPLE